MKALRAEAKKHDLPLETTEGAKHTVVRIGERRTTVPRHREINEITAEQIFKQMGMKA